MPVSWYLWLSPSTLRPLIYHQWKMVEQGRRKISIPLLRNEGSLFLLFEYGITTCTVFEGDLDQAHKYLTERVSQILALNPWLAGWLEYKERRLHLTYDRDCSIEEELPRIFSVYDRHKLNLSSNSSYKTVRRVLTSRNPKFVRSGRRLIWRRGSPIYGVGVFPCVDDEKRYVVAVSLSHCVADGHTYYSLMNMMWPGGSPAPLSVERAMNFESGGAQQELGSREYRFMWRTGLMLNAMFTVAKNFLIGRKSTMSMYYVDEAKVASMKQESTVEVPFVSTNDLISAGVARVSSPDLFMMAINMRDRVSLCPEVTVDCAGNYEASVIYLRGDYDSPALIRKSLMRSRGGRIHRCGSQESHLPSHLDTLRCSIGFITNWSSSANDMEIPGSTTIVHMPVFPPQPEIPLDVSVIFRAGNGRLGILMWGPRFSHQRVRAAIDDGILPFSEPFPSHLDLASNPA